MMRMTNVWSWTIMKRLLSVRWLHFIKRVSETSVTRADFFLKRYYKKRYICLSISLYINANVVLTISNYLACIHFLLHICFQLLMKTLRATWQWTISSLELICDTKMLWNISYTPRNKKEKTLPIRSLLSYRLFSILWGFVLRFIMMTIFLPTANIPV